ncbi:MAG: FkbM family methyltransferase [Cyanobacteriota bacterium]|nr:FkbM family methyltransferase [Cyanobacteriota bacterium]
MNSEQIRKILEESYLSEKTLEKDVLRNLHQLLSSGTIFVDVGANIGQSIFQGNKIIEKGSIYAIEPDPTRFALLKENSRKWEPLYYNTIHVANIAMSDKNSEDEPFFVTNSPVSGFSTKYNLSNLEEKVREAVTWQEITVASYKLDTLFKAIDPDLIKIATGGNELKILQGATKILKKGKARFLIEPYERKSPKISNYNFEDICHWMKGFGYEQKAFYSQVLFSHPKKFAVNRLQQACLQMLPEYPRRRLLRKMGK